MNLQMYCNSSKVLCKMCTFQNKMSIKRCHPCFLRCLASRHPDIPLPHNEETFLGRGPVTKIVDPRFVFALA